MVKNHTAGLALAFLALGVSAASAQSMLVDVMQRHGVMVKAGEFDAAFDAHAEPTVPVDRCRDGDSRPIEWTEGMQCSSRVRT